MLILQTTNYRVVGHFLLSEEGGLPKKKVSTLEEKEYVSETLPIPIS